ncbi:PhnA domain-containing protein [Kitasatospora sp. NPDC056181]|uniref:PhnA domain-containing protein n=1 Tax=Kitasatospora sp. NPDC056181 TaxID=3345737 RepID=UPI0035DACCC1
MPRRRLDSVVVGVCACTVALRSNGSTARPPPVVTGPRRVAAESWVAGCGPGWFLRSISRGRKAIQPRGIRTSPAPVEASQIRWLRQARHAVEPVARGSDTVTVIKDLRVEGSSSGIKVGTTVRNIRLVEGVDGHDIDWANCGVSGVFSGIGRRTPILPDRAGAPALARGLGRACRARSEDAVRASVVRGYRGRYADRLACGGLGRRPGPVPAARAPGRKPGRPARRREGCRGRIRPAAAEMTRGFRRSETSAR